MPRNRIKHLYAVLIVLIFTGNNLAQTERNATLFNPTVQSQSDLLISPGDIRFSKSEEYITEGDTITISVTVHNVGTESAFNIVCAVYCIDPDTSGVAPIIGGTIIKIIAVNDSASFDFKYVVPANPQYYKITAKVDPQNLIHELNRSNNKVSKKLVPDEALSGPLSVSIDAASSVAIKDGVIKPNTIRATLNITNLDTAAITNAKVTLALLDGLIPTSFNMTKKLGDIKKDTTVTTSYQIGITKSVPGFNRYQFVFTGDNISTKTIERVIFVPDDTPPLSPANFKGTVVDSGSVSLTWDANTEADLNGYILFYSEDGINWNAFGADQGDSPLITINKNTATLTGLNSWNMGGTKYFFMLKAFDTSNNISEPALILQLILNPDKNSQRLFYGDGNPIKWTAEPSNPPLDGEIAGCVFGTNRFHDLGKYEKFDSVSNVLITRVKIFFWRKITLSTPDNFNLVIRGVNPNGAPDKLLYEKSISVNDVDTSRFGRTANEFNIDKSVVLNGPFFVGVEWDSVFNDQIGIVADTNGHGDGQKRAWEKWGDGSFHVMNDSWNSGSLDADIWIQAFVQTATDIKTPTAHVPNDFVLCQNYPNPFNPSTVISYRLPVAGMITLKVYDVLGREVATLVDEFKQAGIYHSAFSIQSSAFSSGIYFYRLTAGKFSSIKKMVLLK